jgi:large conductance mechanosensitive channel
MAKKNPEVEVTAKAKGGHARRPKVTVLVSPDEVAEFGHGFVQFLRDYAVVGLAVGFIIGLQAQAVVKQLVSSFIDPLFTLLFGQVLNKERVTLHFHGRTASIGWGAFVYALLDFLFVMLLIYVVVKVFKLDRFTKPKEAKM